MGYLFVLGLFVEGEVEVKYGFFEVLGEVYLLPGLDREYLYSLTMTVSEFLTETMSPSPLLSSFLERGRLRMATRIFGCSIFKILINTTYFQSLQLTTRYKTGWLYNTSILLFFSFAFKR